MPASEPASATRRALARLGGPVPPMLPRQLTGNGGSNQPKSPARGMQGMDRPKLPTVLASVGAARPGATIPTVSARGAIFALVVAGGLVACGGQTDQSSSRDTRGGQPDAGLGGSAGATGAALPLECAGPNGEPIAVDGFVLPWSDLPEPPQRSSFHHDGGFFAVGDRAVYVVSPAGMVQQSALVSPTGEETPVLVYPMSPAGDAFIARWQGSWPTVHDTHGNCLGTIEPAVVTDGEGRHLGPEELRFSRSGHRVVVQVGAVTLDSFIAQYAQLHSLDGQLLVSVPLGATEASVTAAASDEGVFVAIGARLTRYALDGQAEWEMQFESPVADYVVSPDGSRLTVELYAGWIAHVVDGRVERQYELDAPLRGGIAFSPSGVFSAAASLNPGRLMRFELGENLPAILLPVQYADTLDVSDDGDVAVGGEDEANATHVLLYAPDGSLRWDCRGPDETAYTAVHFTDSGRALFVWWRGLYAYLRL